MLNRKILVSLLFLPALMLGSCAQKAQTAVTEQQKSTTEVATTTTQQQEEYLRAEKEELERKAQELERAKKELEMKAKMLEEERKELERIKAQQEKIKNYQNVKAEELCEIDVVNGVPLVPPQAKPGECFAIGYLPPKYRYEKVKILIDEGGEKVITIPPKFRTVPKRILVKEGAKKLICLPPEYKTVKEKIMIRPPAKKKVVIKPAVYKWVEEKIIVEPAKRVWKRGESFLSQAIATRFDPNTGDILCLVEVPPKYKVIRKRVMVQPPIVKEIELPPVYKTITKKILVKPARTKEVEIPPVYKTIYVKELVEPAKVERVQIPPKYDYITRKIKIRDEKFLWVKVLCKTNMTRDMIMKLQKALKEKGYYKGPIDGIYGPLTQEAVVKFQKDHDIPITPGAVTEKALKLLGLI